MSRAWMNHASAALVLMTSAACNISDQLPTRRAGDPCATEGARAEQFVCRGGVWTPVAMADMTTADMAPVDMMPAPDMPVDMSCVGESDAEICAMLGRCALEMSVVDRCDHIRNVICPESCAQGICIPATGLCEGDCVPTACPTDVMCGRVSNGCGAMQLCDACNPGQMCNPDTLECECEAPDPSIVCPDRGCGEISATNACAQDVRVDCGTCDSGFCSARSMCEEIERIDVAGLDALEDGARFGQSIDLSLPDLIVGAPGQPTASGTGNAYILTLVANSWEKSFDAREQLTDTSYYNGYAMGSSVAISASKLALIGKSHIDAPSPHPTRIVLLYSTGSSWQGGLTLDSEGISAGQVVTMSGNSAAVSSPTRGSRGLVDAYEFIEQDPTQPLTSEYRGRDEGDKMGTSVDITSTHLAFGAPGRRDGQGGCYVAKKTNDEQWGIDTIVTADVPQDGAQFCHQVALGTDLLAATFYNRSSNGQVMDAILLFSPTGDDANPWELRQDLLDPEGSSNQGFGTAIEVMADGTILVGNPLHSSAQGDEVGVVYVYQRPDPSQGYELVTQIRSPNPISDGHFGTSIASSGELIAIGAPGESTDRGAQTGAVYTLTLD